MEKNKGYMKRVFKCLLIAVVAFLLIYNSVYIKKLSAVKASGEQDFVPAAFAEKIWEQRMPEKIAAAPDLQELINEINTNKEAALKKYTHAMAVGNYRYALIKLKGQVTGTSEDQVELQVMNGNTSLHVILATEYIYGNAIRDASGLLNIKDFPNTDNLNAVSEELNRLVRKTVLPAFKNAVKKGITVYVTAAAEINKEHIRWDGLELFPLQLQIAE